MNVLRALSGIRNPFLDVLLNLISMLGTPFVILGVIAWIFWNVNRQDGWAFGISFFLSGMTGQGLKIVARVPRPWVLDPSFQPVKAAVSTATGYSFPSVHATSTASFTSGAFYRSRKTSTRVFLVVFLAVIIFSRMYLGVHTPLDVLVGSVIGIAGSVIILPILSRFGEIDEQNCGSVIFFPLAFAALFIVLAAFLVFNETVSAPYAKDCFETCGSAIGFALSIPAVERYFRFQETGSTRTRILRLLLGTAGFLIIEFGLKSLAGDSPLMLVIRYTLISLWLFTGTPAVGLRIGLFQEE